MFFVFLLFLLLNVYLAMSEAVTKTLVSSCSVKQDSISGQECRDTAFLLFSAVILIHMDIGEKML